ncbi:MAG TPA: TDP-N-acetylfucosamine:lipid II N-acetylfucosaminyltransferase [Epulopiscium sp.]|nr:TDP-N-acetylfucosamine:lipid II N-acetylfucosaminyltransferase [Candidatus Epulonipiscium sp.]
MVLHIILDDKFGKIIIQRFLEINPQQNIFIVVSNNSKIQNIPLDYAQKTTLIHPNNIVQYVDSYMENSTAIVFHGLNEEYKWQMIERYKGKVHLHWKFWGTDGYMLPHMRKGLLEKETKKLKLKLYNITPLRYYLTNSGGFIFNLYAWQYKLRNNDDHFLKKLEKAIRTVDSISSVVIDDYYKIKKALNLKSPHLYLYYTADKVENIGIKNNTPSGKNIIIGNSASIENNHLDAFQLLKKLNINNRKIIVPLNYGAGNYTTEFLNLIINNGILNFGCENFMPLTNFLDVEEYAKLLSSCSHAVMFHNKQHAAGNINMLLYIGAKVFLSKKNPIYSFLKRNNFIVFNTNQLSQEQLDTSLTQKEIKQNRNQLAKIYSPQLITERHKILFNVLIQK